MADEVLLRDQNHVTVAAGVSPDSDLDISMFRVDPVTSYLLVDVTASGAAVGNSGQIAKRDQNFRPVCLAYDEDNDELVEVLTDSDGNLLVDISFS